MWASPKLLIFSEKREGKEDGRASGVMERQIEGAAGETRGKGEHNLVTLSGTGGQKKKYVLQCSWQEIEKDETEDRLKTRRLSEMVKRWSLA